MEEGEGGAEGRGWGVGGGVEVEKGGADAEVVKLVVGVGPVEGESGRAEDGRERGGEEGEVFGVGGEVGDGFDAAVEGRFGIPSRRGDAAREEAVGHPGGVGLGGGGEGDREGPEGG